MDFETPLNSNGPFDYKLILVRKYTPLKRNDVRLYTFLITVLYFNLVGFTAYSFSIFFETLQLRF